MYTATIIAALLASGASLVAAGQATVNNYCSYNVVVNHVDGNGQQGGVTIGSNGGRYVENISGSGVSIKLTRDGNVYGGNVSFAYCKHGWWRPSLSVVVRPIYSDRQSYTVIGRNSLANCARRCVVTGLPPSTPTPNANVNFYRRTSSTTPSLLEPMAVFIGAWAQTARRFWQMASKSSLPLAKRFSALPAPAAAPAAPTGRLRMPA